MSQILSPQNSYVFRKICCNLCSFFRKICLNLRTFFRKIWFCRDLCTFPHKICHNLNTFFHKIWFCRDLCTFPPKICYNLRIFFRKICCELCVFFRKILLSESLSAQRFWHFACLGCTYRVSQKKLPLVKIKTGNFVLITTGEPNELHKMYTYLKKAEGLSFLQIIVYFL